MMMENDDGKVTDDAMVVETYGNVPVKLFEGGYDNIKVTTPEDVRLATNLVRVRKVFHKLHVLHDKLIYLQMKAYKKRFREKKQKK
jgi:2-C-methyl-D-erythritol 4-phosphate cytidylyltransferase